LTSTEYKTFSPGPIRLAETLGVVHPQRLHTFLMIATLRPVLTISPVTLLTAAGKVRPMGTDVGDALTSNVGRSSTTSAPIKHVPANPSMTACSTLPVLTSFGSKQARFKSRQTRFLRAEKPLLCVCRLTASALQPPGRQGDDQQTVSSHDQPKAPRGTPLRRFLSQTGIGIWDGLERS
jgi:hypothetical protein